MTAEIGKVFSFYNEVGVPESIKPFLSNSEKVLFAVKTIRDVSVFTDKRILAVDKQGISGKKIEYYSIPYKNIITYSIETAGTFDLDSEIKLKLSGGISVEMKFFKNKEMDKLLLKVYKILTDYVIG